LRRRCFRRWYGRLRRAFPGKLPPPSKVSVSFAVLKDAYATVEMKKVKGKVVKAHIRIDRKIKDDAGQYILAEFAHEMNHMIRPRMPHGRVFEHQVIDIKVICEPKNISWY